MIKSILLLMFLTAATINCGSQSTTDKIEAPCKNLSGIYSFTFEKKSGACMPIIESKVNVDYVGDKDCEVIRTNVSGSGCHMNIEFKCPHPYGVHSDLTGTLDVNTDGNSGTGTLHFSLVDDERYEIICTSDYAMKFKR